MWSLIEEHSTSIQTGCFILFVVTALILVGFIWGLYTASDIACRNLGYDWGDISLLNKTITCVSDMEIAIPDMYLP